MEEIRSYAERGALALAGRAYTAWRCQNDQSTGDLSEKASEHRCPSCGTSDVVFQWQVRDRLFRTTAECFTIYKCLDCHLVFLWPVPSAIQTASYYPAGYWASSPQATGGVLRHKATELYRRVMLRDHLRFVRQAITEQQSLGKRVVDVLDVGCGDGLFLSALGHKPCAGLDFSDGAVAACRDRGIETWQGSLDHNPFTSERRFDLVTMFHFLEHVSPAGPILENTRRILAPGGELIVQVPNCASVQARFLGRYWAGYDVPRHLIHYTPETLQESLKRSHFEIVQVSYGSIRDNPTTLANSIAPGLYPPARVARGRAVEGWRAWVGDLMYLVLCIACVLPTQLEATCRRGAVLTVRARVRT